MIASRKEAALKQEVVEIQSNYPGKEANIAYCVCDIRQEDQVIQLMHTTQSTFGPLTLLFCNAGGQFPSHASSMSLKGFKAVVDLNLNSTFSCCLHAFHEGGMQACPQGSIVLMGCDCEDGFPGMAHTSAARAGVANLAKTLALEWACERIRVNAVAPGVIYNTSAEQHYDKTAPGMLQGAVPGIPARRLGTCEEVAQAVVFLLGMWIDCLLMTPRWSMLKSV